MPETIDLDKYHAEGIRLLLSDAMKAALHTPRQSAFIARFALACRRAEKRRAANRALGQPIPPFLIASITASCNLSCAGCYARANSPGGGSRDAALLRAEEWEDIFSQAEELGVSFIILAGGEPTLRPEVLEKAARHKNILFPVFTNGTLLKGETLALFDACRNLVPLLSLEGDASLTDARRGPGIYAQLDAAMRELRQRAIFFGVSMTISKENLDQASGDAFLSMLRSSGCRLVIFVEYVPVESDAGALAPTAAERARLAARLNELRQADGGMMYISFPGDELASGGCLAAGRGFFHINANGGAEPCPFSPYSDTNVKTSGLRAALNSPLFRRLVSGEALLKEHAGGCVLFEQQDLVRQMLRRT